MLEKLHRIYIIPHILYSSISRTPRTISVQSKSPAQLPAAQLQLFHLSWSCPLPCSPCPPAPPNPECPFHSHLRRCPKIRHLPRRDMKPFYFIKSFSYFHDNFVVRSPDWWMVLNFSIIGSLCINVTQCHLWRCNLWWIELSFQQGFYFFGSLFQERVSKVSGFHIFDSRVLLTMVIY